VLALVGIVQKARTQAIYGPDASVAGRPVRAVRQQEPLRRVDGEILPLAVGHLSPARPRRVCDGGTSMARSPALALTPEAHLVLTAGGIAIMGLALLLTFSFGHQCARSGTRGDGWLMVRQQGAAKLTAAGSLSCSITLVASVGATRREPLRRRGARDGRLGIWADARDTVERHWLTGTGLNTYQFSNISTRSTA
jgi:hypothetical protein